MNKKVLIVFLFLFFIIIPQTAYAWDPLNIGEKVETWLQENIQAGQEETINWMRQGIFAPEPLGMSQDGIKWHNINFQVAWPLFGILLAIRLQSNLTNPFLTGRIEFDSGSVYLTAIGAGAMIYMGQYLIEWLRLFSSSFTAVYTDIPVSIIYGDDGIESLGWFLIYGTLQIGLIVLILLLNALYEFRTMFVDFFTSLAPLVGATIVLNPYLFKKWGSILIAFILMKPLHALAIGFYMDYVPHMDNPGSRVVLSIIFFLFILLFPILILGNAVVSVVKDIKKGGGYF